MEIWQLAVLFAILAVVVWWLSMTAGRIDRVHIRKDDALNSLRLQLAWRASAIAWLYCAVSKPRPCAKFVFQSLPSSVPLNARTKWPWPSP